MTQPVNGAVTGNTNQPGRDLALLGAVGGGFFLNSGKNIQGYLFCRGVILDGMQRQAKDQSVITVVQGT